MRIFKDWQDFLGMGRGGAGPEGVIEIGLGRGGNLAARGLAAGVTGVSRGCRCACGIGNPGWSRTVIVKGVFFCLISGCGGCCIEMLAGLWICDARGGWGWEKPDRQSSICDFVSAVLFVSCQAGRGRDEARCAGAQTGEAYQ